MEQQLINETKMEQQDKIFYIHQLLDCLGDYKRAAKSNLSQEIQEIKELIEEIIPLMEELIIILVKLL